MNPFNPSKFPAPSWRIQGHTIALKNTHLMGILNTTPDSFSDGGRFLEPDVAVKHGVRMWKEGAHIVDVGGESTRPGAHAVLIDEQCRRVLPVIEGLRAKTSDLMISIDTTDPEVAAAAVAAGADIINDVSGLRDPRMIEVAAKTGAGVVIMHMQGDPRSMQKNPVYNNVVDEVLGFLEERAGAAEKGGVHPEAIAIDPGIGFGKTLDHNLELIREIPRFTAWGRPLLLGASRKSFLETVTGVAVPDQRLWSTVGLSAFAVSLGARVLRVHDVKENRDAVRAVEAVLHGFGDE